MVHVFVRLVVTNLCHYKLHRDVRIRSLGLIKTMWMSENRDDLHM